MNNKKYAKVEGHPNLLRDLSTNAIINTDKIGSDHYTRSRDARLKEKERLTKVESDVEEIKSSINDIKTMLRNLYES